MTEQVLDMSLYGGQRLDAALASALPEHSRTILQRWIKDGQVTVNGKKSKAGQKIEPSDRVILMIPEAAASKLAPEEMGIPVLYEDKDLIVVNKPRGLVVHPAAGHADGTLVNALLAQCGDLSGIGGEIRPGIVHRLDKDTSGTLVVAKNDKAHQSLADQIRERTAKRVYWTIVQGRIEESKGRIVAPIGRHKTDRKKMAVLSQGGKDATTEFVVLKRFEDFSLVQCHLVTGRTHQIRVHLAYIGYPVVGDPLYGTRKQKFEIDGQALHAKELSFIHPTTGERISCEAPLPDDMIQILEELEKDDRSRIIENLEKEEREI